MEATLTAPARPEGEGRQERIFTWLFLNLMLANGLVRICTYMLIALVPLYVLDQGMGPTVAGLTTALYMAAALVFRPSAGNLVATRGRYFVMFVGATAYCAATALFAVTLPIWLLLAVRALQGFGFSFTSTAVMTVATDIIPEHRMSEGIGFLGIEQTIAQVFGPFFALWLLENYGYQAGFLVVSLLGVLNVIVRFPMRAQIKRIDAERLAAHQLASEEAKNCVIDVDKDHLIYRIVDRDAWKPAVIMFFIMFGAASINTFMAVYVMGRGIVNSGPFFAASGIAVVAARIAVGRIERRVGSGWTIGTGIGLIALALLGILWSPNVIVLAAAGALYGLGIGVAQPGINALAVLAAKKENRGLANSTFFMAMDAAQAIGSLALGFVAGAMGIASVFVVAAGVAVLTLAAFLGLRLRGFIR